MVQRTGFWVNEDNSRVLWARDNRSNKRSELWELFVSFDAYEWRDRSDLFRQDGFVEYIAGLRAAGYSLVQQPNGFTRDVVELPKLPFPGALLSGGTGDEGVWHYMPAVDVAPSADTVAMHEPARWVCAVAECADDISDLGDNMPDEPDAVTQEIPEVPPSPNSDAKVYVAVDSVIPAGIPVKDIPALQSYGRKQVKHFRDSQGRKLVYVGCDGTTCRVVWRDWYQHDDEQLDATVREYVASLGFAA